MFTIQYISDIYLNQRGNFNIDPVSKNLVLCGNIGYLGSIEYDSFIKQCANKFKNVFVVFGNHEFYNFDSIIETISQKKQYANFPENVYILDNNSVYINVVTNEVTQHYPCEHISQYVKLIGSTLWSETDYCDFHNIYVTQTETFDEVYSKSLHIVAVDYIVKELRRDKLMACIVLTHHPIINEKVDLSCIYLRPNFLGNIYGHTLVNVSETIDDGNLFQLLSNQVGYVDDNIGFDCTRIFSLPTLS